MADFDEEKDDRFDEEENDFVDGAEEAKVFELGHVMRLTKPFKLGEKNYTELVFRNELEYRHIKHFPASEGLIKLGHFAPPLQGMTGLPSAVIDRIRPGDFQRATEVLGYFLALGREGEITADE